jgi:secreted trypsin-like serine protease
MSPFARSLLPIAASLITSSLAQAATLGSGDAIVPERDVVGGRPTTQGEWPDTVAVLQDGQAFCSGTLIAPDVVMTAGHCTEVAAEEVKINAIDSTGAGEVIPVIQIIPYPDWAASYDVGLLVLEHASVTPPRAILPSCAVDQLTDGAPIDLVGYGATTVDGETRNTVLNEVRVSVADADCSGVDGCVGAIAPGGEFAAGAGGIGSCFGDSGGPAYLTTDFGVFLAGVVSRGYDNTVNPCGDGGIYVRADKVLDWARQATGRVIADATCPEDNDGDGGTGGTDGTDDGDGVDESPDASGGCSAAGSEAGHASLGLLVALGLMLVSPTRRRR